MLELDVAVGPAAPPPGRAGRPGPARKASLPNPPPASASVRSGSGVPTRGATSARWGHGSGDRQDGRDAGATAPAGRHAEVVRQMRDEEQSPPARAVRIGQLRPDGGECRGRCVDPLDGDGGPAGVRREREPRPEVPHVHDRLAGAPRQARPTVRPRARWRSRSVRGPPAQPSRRRLRPRRAARGSRGSDDEARVARPGLRRPGTNPSHSPLGAFIRRAGLDGTGRRVDRACGRSRWVGPRKGLVGGERPELTTALTAHDSHMKVLSEMSPR